jgi:hypothetical protein
VRYVIYSCTLADHDGDESDTSANERSILKPHKIVSFESHPSLGWPLLPKMGDMTSQECKDTMRAFVTATYRESVTPWHLLTSIKHFIGHFTRDSHAKVPWKDLSLDEQHDLISSDSFPEDMRLLDPSKLQRSDIEALWKHWTRRQKANSRPLIFYPSAALNIRRAKAHPGQPKKAPRPSPQHVSEEEDDGDNDDKDKAKHGAEDEEEDEEDEEEEDNKDDNKDDDDDDHDDDEDKADNKKSETPHPHSPAAHASSPSSKIDFLRTLSSDLVYTEFVDRLSSREEVSVLLGGIYPI